jgi:hypothetical protein
LDHLSKGSNLASPHPAWPGLTRLSPAEDQRAG